MPNRTYFPEAIEWGLNPLYWSPLKLFNIQIVHDRLLPSNTEDRAYPAITQVKERNCCHSIDSRVPVSRAQLVGFVVERSNSKDRVTYVVDDGTALVRCVQWLQGTRGQQRYIKPIKLGQRVQCTGRLSLPPLNRNMGNDRPKCRELILEQIDIIHDPNEEILYWLESINLNDTVYGNRSGDNSSWNSFRDEHADCLPELHDLGRLKKSKQTQQQELDEDRPMHKEFAKRLYSDILVVNQVRPALRDEYAREDVAPDALRKGLFAEADLITLDKCTCIAQEIANEAGIQLHDTGIGALVRRSLCYLVQRGYVFEWGDLFGVVSHELTLAPVLLTTIAQHVDATTIAQHVDATTIEQHVDATTIEQQVDARSEPFVLDEEHLIDRVKSDDRWKHVTRKQIRKSIQRLLASGIILRDEQGVISIS